ncbi:chain length determinant protein [Pontibacter anaerobius]|uniref:Chain length determinant protein n=1 Tax=Pontibacter anaerobius TaxID=2993940 RepID=A0ABT3RJT1_9BACT|nr:chain length determinant protein [Pontibacter anaerobius]MCX2741562.1 chain length determinant protein [Pontibacter anaerobius]
MQQIEKDEIDVAEVFRYISQFFSSIKKRIQYLFETVFSYKLLVLGITVIGLGLGYLAYSLVKPYYTSSMTLMLANIRNEFIEDQLNKLSVMIGEGNYVAVAERLEITETSAQQIKEMKFSNLDQDRIEEDSVLTGSPFRIELTLYNRELFESMEPALTNYLENNRYFAKQKRIKQRQVESMISKLKGEISSIDSMKTNVGDPRGPVNGFVYGQPIDPTNMYRESIILYKEQVELEADLENLDNVEIVTGFIPKLLPTGPSLKRYLAISAFSAFIIGVIVALSLDSKKRRKLA